MRGQRRIINLEGRVFGRLTALCRDSVRSPSGKIRWVCRCECGVEKSVEGALLREGRTQSCGCLQRELSAAAATKHGLCPKKGEKWSPEYLAWTAMIARCEQPKHKAYADYGGRGIRVCDRWRNDYATFRSDMGAKPAGWTLDRIDVNGNYEPANCRWASRTVQCRNKRSNHRVAHNGETLSLAEWAERTGIPAARIWHRIRAAGWSVEEALTKPAQTARTRKPKGWRDAA